MTTISQSSSPLVTQPEVLTQDALKSTDAELMRALSAPRRRGRPPGSKNKPKMDSEGRLTGGPQPRVIDPDKKPTKDEIDKRLRDKKKRQDEISKKIITEGNEALMSLAMQFGVPGSLLYINPPVGEVLNPNYTPIANQIAIKPALAKVLAATAVELEGSSLGQQLSSVALQDSPIRLGVLVIASVIMAGTHIKNVLDLREKFAPFIAIAKEQKKNQQQEGDVIDV